MMSRERGGGESSGGAEKGGQGECVCVCTINMYNG